VVIENLARDIKDSIKRHKCEVAIVVGGGNFVRGAELHRRAKIIHESTGHYMGMLATVMNSLALRDILESVGQPARIFTKIDSPKVAESFTRLRAEESLENGEVVIVAGGTGGPFLTTDTASVTAGLELSCDAVVKITKVDGVYDKDPMKHTDAKKYSKLTFDQVFANGNIKVMDKAAMAMAHENNIPILVTELKKGMITNILGKNFNGTKIS
jgi:uridylate kinase